MEIEKFISIEEFCEHYNIPISFLNSLHEFELIEIVSSKNIRYIREIHIKSIEKMIRLHYELDINMEGMDVIYKLLHKVESLKDDIVVLKNKLRFYEEM